jgi:CSLREA domain-containing protein
MTAVKTILVVCVAALASLLVSSTIIASEDLDARAAAFLERRSGDVSTPLNYDMRRSAQEAITARIEAGELRGPTETGVNYQWTSIGPSPLIGEGEGGARAPYTGRVTAIAAVPGEPDIVFIGTAAGGVWKSTDRGYNWEPMSDFDTNPQSDEIRSLAIGSLAIATPDPTDQDYENLVVYAGTGEGNLSCDSYFGAGILKSSNSGETWTNVSRDDVTGVDPFDGMSISDLVVHPLNPDIVWAATTFGISGNIDDNCLEYQDNVLNYKFGVWMSTDGGVTWDSATFFDADSTTTKDSVTSLVLDPSPGSVTASSARLYAGVRHWQDPDQNVEESAGLYELSYQNLAGVPTLGQSLLFGFCDDGANCTDCDQECSHDYADDAMNVVIAVNPTHPSEVYAAIVKNWILEPDGGQANLGAGLYMSEDSGATWKKLALPGPSNKCQSEHLYWDYVGGTPPDQNCEGGKPCTVRNVCERYEHQHVCYYALDMAVSQSGDLWIGGLGLWSRDAQSLSWEDECEWNIHVDQHAIEFVSDTTGREYVYIGNDGGVAFGDLNVANPKLVNLHAESTDTPSIDHPLSITQFHPGAARHSDGIDALAVVGTQDNGTIRGFRDGQGGGWSWDQILPWSDGARNQIAADFMPWNRWFANRIGNRILQVLEQAGGFAISELKPHGYRSFYPDFAVCQSNPNVIISTMESFDGVDRTETGGGSGAWQREEPPHNPGAYASSLVFGPDSCDTYFAGFGNGEIWRRDSDGQNGDAWTNVYEGGAARVLDLDLYPSASGELSLYAVFAPSPTSSHSRIKRFDQPFGDSASITSVDLDRAKSGESYFEDNPVNAVLVVSDTPAVVYAGTDHGVFRSDDAGENWGLMSGGHPETIVHDIEEVDGSVVSFTHGRGAWRLDIIESILVSAPSSGQTHVIHSKMEIQWEASIEEDDALVDIQLSRDGGDNYESLLLEPIPASNGQETWIVTGDPTDTAKIRISEAVSGQVFGTSTGVFSIVAEPYLVNTTADSVDANLSDNICLDAAGDCSLRAAIQQANAKPGTQTVAFAITSSGVPTIQPGSRLPVVSDSIVIDGGTQIPGGLVELDGSAAGASQGLYFTSDNNVVRGLVINRFSQAGIALFGDGGGGFSTIQGCRIGTDTTGKLALGNGGTGIRINNSVGNTVWGSVVSGNASGIYIDGLSRRTTITGNMIGIAGNGIDPIPNTGAGIRISGADLNLIGSSDGDGNVIAFNGGHGIFVSSGASNAVAVNSIHDNGGLGINLGQDWITANDVDDGDSGANDLLNYPIPSSFTVDASGTPTVTGTFDTEPTSAGWLFAINLWSNSACDPSGHGEGEVYAGSALVVLDASGDAGFSVPLDIKLDPGETVYVSATASFIVPQARQPVDMTSEFSPCLAVTR